MKVLAKTSSTDRVAIATGVTALDLPPPSFAPVPSWWNNLTVASGLGCVPEVDIEMWAAGAVSLTNVELFGGTLHPFTFGDLTVTANATTNQLNAAGHGKETGDGPCLLTGADVPGNTDTVTQYWLIKVDANNVKLALSLEDALAGDAVDLTDAGSGTINIVDIPPDTQRVWWTSHGLLGPAEDGAVDLSGTLGYWCTRPHRPQVVAYALKATFGGSVEVSAAILPVSDA